MLSKSAARKVLLKILINLDVVVVGEGCIFRLARIDGSNVLIWQLILAGYM